MDHLIVGVVLVSLAIALIYIGIPNRAGQHSRFLRFKSSLVLYPPMILVFFAMGMALIVRSLLGI